MLKRIFALMMALALVLSVVPTTALAEDDTTPEKVCTCGAQPNEDGTQTHTSDCALYEEPETIDDQGGEDTPVCTGDENCTLTQGHNEGCPKAAPAEDDQGGEDNKEEDTPVCTGNEDCPLTQGHNEGCPVGRGLAPAACTCGTETDTHATDCPKYVAPAPVCTGDENCPLTQGHNEGCPVGRGLAPAVCTCGTETDTHAADCPKYVTPTPVCTCGTETEEHTEDCPLHVIPCDGSLECKAEAHNEACLKAKADQEAAEREKCTLDENCEAALHKEGGCPKAYATLEEMIDALPSLEAVAEMTQEERVQVNNALLAISGYAEKNFLELSEEQEALLGALTVALNEATVIPEDTWTGTIGATSLTGGTAEEPLVITVDGEVSVTGKIAISSGYVTIQGTNGGTLKRDASYTSADLIAIVNNANLTIDGVTLDGSNIPSNGGLIKNGGGLTINNSTLQNSNFAASGTYPCSGAIWSDYYYQPTGNLVITNSTIQNNSSNGWGGGLCTGRNNLTTLTNVTFKNNSAQAGGGLFAYGNTSMTNVSFTGNSATDVGGAVRGASGAEITANGCTMTGNTAVSGGAVYLYGNSSLSLLGGAVKDNTATNGTNICFASTTGSYTLGGGVAVAGFELAGGTADAPMVITVDGTANLLGTINVKSGYVTIQGDGGDMLKRASDFTGQMISISKDATLVIDKLTLDGGAVWTGETNAILNRGTVNAGIEGTTLVYQTGPSTLTIKNSILQNNDGGHVLETGGDRAGTKMLVENCQLINNRGGAGAAAFAFGLTVKNSEIAYNECGNGAIRAISGAGACTVSGGSIRNNCSSDKGGAIYSYGADLVLENVSITDNVSATEDGAMYFESGTLTLNNATVTRNSAPQHGGIHVYTSSVNFLGTTTVSDNANGNFYIGSTYNRTFKVEDTIGNVGWSWNFDAAQPKFTKNSADTDLAKVIAKLPYEGSNETDTAKVLFIAENTIEVATVVLNDGALSSIYTTEKGTLPTATKAGYTFQGWCTDEALTTPTGELAANTTYYAKWATTTTFDACGGQVSPASMDVTVGKPYGTLPTPTRGGYNFQGWFTAAENGDKVEATTVPTAMTTLYAQWEAKPYTIILEVNGGTAMEPIHTAYDRVVALPAATKDGYKFVGWADKDGKLAFSADSTVKNLGGDACEDVTLYALWEEQKLVRTPDIGIQTHDYTGKPQKFELDGPYTVTYYQDGVKVDYPIGLGSYDVIIEAEETSEYKAYHAQVLDGLVIKLINSSIMVAQDNSPVTYGEELIVQLAIDLSGKIKTTRPERVSFFLGQTSLGYAEIVYTSNDDEMVESVHGAASFAYDTALKGIPAGKHYITAAYGNGDYESAYPVAVEVKPKELTVSGLTATDRVYNGSTDVTITGGSLSGKVKEDDAVAIGSVTASMANANAGSGKAVTVTGVTLSGEDAGFYTVAAPADITVDISKAPAPAGCISFSAGKVYVLDTEEEFLMVPAVTVPVGDTATVTYASSKTDVATVDATGKVSILKAGETTITATVAFANYENATASYPLVIVDANGYSIIQGDDQTIQNNAAEPFASNADFDKFVEVRVDGKVLVRDVDYTAKSGSTVITLTDAFIKTLVLGKHTLTIVSTDGAATAEFTVTKTASVDTTQVVYVKYDSDCPKTGDTTQTGVYLVLVLAGTFGLLLTLLAKKKYR